MNQQEEIKKLSHELTYQRYLMNQGAIRDVFAKLSVSEYLVLHHISGKTYLKDLAAKMQISIRHASRIIGALQERGMLVWSHDGDGSEGTYVAITESGMQLLKQQEELLKQYYGKVIEKFGKENLIQLIELMKQLENVMSSEVENMEVPEFDDESME